MALASVCLLSRWKHLAKRMYKAALMLANTQHTLALNSQRGISNTWLQYWLALQ